MNTNFPNRVTNLTVNDLSTDPEIVKALAAYDAKHKGCQCDLRDRQWDGHSKCLTCRRRYLDDRSLLQGYSGIHKGWDRLLAAVTPVADGAHAVTDLGPDLSDDFAEHDSNGEA